LKLGYLTGKESQVSHFLGGMLMAHALQEMVDAHVQSILLLAIPFRKETPQPYNFEDQTVREKIRALIPFMLQNRLTPPPRETYSLNRKLSGAFLLCRRPKARVDCAGIWEDVTRGYEFMVSDET
jgi:aarF domain-containing kinase